VAERTPIEAGARLRRSRELVIPPTRTVRRSNRPCLALCPLELNRPARLARRRHDECSQPALAASGQHACDLCIIISAPYSALSVSLYQRLIAMGRVGRPALQHDLDQLAVNGTGREDHPTRPQQSPKTRARSGTTSVRRLTALPVMAGFHQCTATTRARAGQQ